jgi:hypothetical protein
LLVEQRLKETRIRAQLFDIQAKKAEKALERADIDVGQVRSTVRQRGYSIHPAEKYLEPAEKGF